MARELGWSAMRQERELEEVYTRFPPRCEGAELR
jgi:hypothetical protein